MYSEVMVTKLGNEEIEMSVKCPVCGEQKPIKLTRSQYDRLRKYATGEADIFTMLPDLTADEREMFISGICPACWKKVFG